MDTFYELEKQIQEDLNSVSSQDITAAATPDNEMKYSDRSVGSLGPKEDYFITQLKIKASALGPQQRFKILGDVLMTLYPDPTERQQYIQLLRIQNMQQAAPVVQ